MAPAASRASFAFSASSFEAPSMIVLGAPSTRSLASLRPKLVRVLTSLITWIFLSPASASCTSKLSFSSASPSSAPAAAGAEDGEAEEKDSFDVQLAEAGDKKIQVIKEVRTLTNLGLKDAKDLVDGAPSTIMEGASKEDAEKAKEALEAAGATIELK